MPADEPQFISGGTIELVCDLTWTDDTGILHRCSELLQHEHYGTTPGYGTEPVFAITGWRHPGRNHRCHCGMVRGEYADG